MKTGIKQYLRFWRPLPLLWIFVSLIGPVLTTCFFWSRADSSVRFNGALVLLPLSFGMGQAVIVARAIHQPAFMLLPDARLYFRTMYALGALVLAVVATVIAHLVVETAMPVTGSVGVVLVFLSLGLIWEPSHRGSGLIGFVVLAVVMLIVAGLRTEVLRTAVMEYPLAIFGFGLVTLPASIAFAFDRERVRVRARSMMLLFGNCRVIAQQRMAQQARLGRDWEREPIGGRFSAWRRALWHARFGGVTWTRSWLIMLSLIVGYAAAVVVALAIYVYSKHDVVAADGIAREFYTVVWANGGEKHVMPFASFVVGMASVFTFMLTLALPVPAFLYPASRRTLMRLSLQVAFLRAVKVSVLGALVIVALAWLASYLATQPFELRPTFLFAIPLTILPFLPLIAAAGLSLVRRPGNPAHVLFSPPGLRWMAMTGASILGPIFLSLFAREILTAGGVTVVAMATVATSAWLVSRARKLFLAGDLIVRNSV